MLLPILGEPFGASLERGDLRVRFEAGSFWLSCAGRDLPLAPETLAPVLRATRARLGGAGLADDAPAALELESVTASLRALPARSPAPDEARRERAREKEVARRRLERLAADEPAVQRSIEAALDELNGAPGDPASFDALEALLDAQSYRLASWRVASEEINYRRFFDVNDLAALRMESPAVFERSHALLFRLLDERRVQALRLDHTDGLYDPLAYFESLQRRFARTLPAHEPASPDDAARPLPLFVEKILEPGEQLPARWPVDGTTGYEFAVCAQGLWVDPRAEASLTATYRAFTGDVRAFSEHVYESKRHVLAHSMASEVHMLARALGRIAAGDRHSRDVTLASLTRALTEVLAASPVYRTYLRADGERAADDVARVREAVSLAREADRSTSAEVYAFVEDALLMGPGGRTALTEAQRAERARFALCAQQLTGPVMAKAVEDTAFYRYTRLVGLNEVGGMPSKWGHSVEEFHRQNADRARSWPLSMVATSTHDTKRGEDSAARIAVLTEMPDAWRAAARRWGAYVAPARRELAGRARAPNARLEYLFFQALVGAWPFGWDGVAGRDAFAARLADYLFKCAKEAKEETSWTRSDPAYDDAVRAFVHGALARAHFVEDARAFCEALGPYGAANGLAQCLLRFCVPGVPDTYQGSELWNQALVDPDNRGPVDFAHRRALLDRVRDGMRDRASLARALLGSYSDGAVKLYVTHAALQTRREFRELFARGDYEAVPAGEHLVALSRSYEGRRVVCVTARFSYAKTRGAVPFAVGAPCRSDERLALPHAGVYEDRLTGAVHAVRGSVAVAELLRDLPVALLVRRA